MNKLITRGSATLIAILTSLCAASLTFGFTQVSSIGRIKDVSSDVRVNEAHIVALQNDQLAIQHQIVEAAAQNEKRIGYIVTMMEADRKTNQEFVGLIRTQNELLSKYVEMLTKQKQ